MGVVAWITSFPAGAFLNSWIQEEMGLMNWKAAKLYHIYITINLQNYIIFPVRILWSHVQVDRTLSIGYKSLISKPSHQSVAICVGTGTKINMIKLQYNHTI